MTNEQRLDALEREVAALKRRVEALEGERNAPPTQARRLATDTLAQRTVRKNVRR